MTEIRRRRRNTAPPEPQPAWPGDPENVTAADVAFEALACLLANTCRWGGRTRRFFSVAQHALVMAEEVETLEGVPDADRRALTLHALLAGARTAWLGDDDGEPASAKAAERGRRCGERIDRAVRKAAGLEPDLPEAWAEILDLVDRMADAAERRDPGLPRPPAPPPCSRRSDATSGPCVPNAPAGSGSPGSRNCLQALKERAQAVGGGDGDGALLARPPAPCREVEERAAAPPVPRARGRCGTGLRWMPRVAGPTSSGHRARRGSWGWVSYRSPASPVGALSLAA